MNYFDFYDLPISFHPDQQLVRQKFYELSKEFHPDFYINESDEKQAEVLELSTVNNKAFQILKDPQKTLSYLLELKEELKAGENYILPQSFLMEMMEVNEGLMELQFDQDERKLAELTDQVNEIEKTLSEELSNLTAKFDVEPPSEQDKLLKAIKDLYYRLKYVDRIKEKM